MSNKYYEIVGEIDGQQEVLFGSFVRAECIYEKDAEIHSWIDEGYKRIKIVSREVQETPDPEVYEELIISKKELFAQQAPNFNFELGEDELLKEALERGFITKINGADDQYLINPSYNEGEFEQENPVTPAPLSGSELFIKRVLQDVCYDPRLSHFIKITKDGPFTILSPNMKRVHDFYRMLIVTGYEKDLNPLKIDDVLEEIEQRIREFIEGYIGGDGRG